MTGAEAGTESSRGKRARTTYPMFRQRCRSRCQGRMGFFPASVAVKTVVYRGGQDDPSPCREELRRVDLRGGHTLNDST